MSVAANTIDLSAYHDKRRVTIVGAVVNLGLAIAKIIFGFIGQSQALIADGLHSLSDLASDAMVLVAAKYGSKGADIDHPYGHARFETAATVGLGLLLLMVAVGIILDAIERLFSPHSLMQPGIVALAVAIISILSKEFLYHYTMIVAKRVRSKMLRANAWHHRSDAVSSIVVLIGIIGAMVGLTYLDAIGAIIVALMIGKIGWELGWDSLKELVDTGLAPADLEDFGRTIDAVPGVKSHHMLRTRRMGEDILVEVHIVVGSTVTVSEGHQISEAVRTRLRQLNDHVTDVMVHIDPENDELESPTHDLPTRDVLLEKLKKSWNKLEGASNIERINLHYLDGHVNVEVLLPLSMVRTIEHARQIAENYTQLANDFVDIGDIRVHFR